MANTREIQSRMKSIQDTLKITNAMYMISSTKLRKARKNLEETEQYFYTLQAMISRILRHLPDTEDIEENPYSLSSYSMLMILVFCGNNLLPVR